MAEVTILPSVIQTSVGLPNSEAEFGKPNIFVIDK